MTLERRAPTPGMGWGCAVCGLPADGAVAVLCDACLEVGAEITTACDGYLGEGRRVPLRDLPPEPFRHDEAAHRRELVPNPLSVLTREG